MLASAALLNMMVACDDSMDEIIEFEEVTTETKGLPESFIAVLPQPNDTRTAYTSDGLNLKTSWTDGDKITISPAHKSSLANVYALQSADGANGTFVKESGSNISTTSWGVYYPGDKIKSDIDFYNFSYLGQVQKKSDPLDHLKDYHTMMSEFSGSGVFPTTYTFDLSQGKQSSCIRFILGGMTFNKPKKISMSLMVNGFFQPVFFENNIIVGSYYLDNDKQYNGSQTTDVLSLELEGYGSETQIEAYMMASNGTVTLPAGSQLLIRVECESESYYTLATLDAAKTIQGGSVLTITTNGAWNEDLNIDYNDYGIDGEVVVINEANVNGGLDLVIMGDGFIIDDFEDGTYESIMMQAYNEFFAIQPFNKFKDDFNVYYVKAVSPQRTNPREILLNGAIGSGTVTKFNATLTANATAISGNNALINEYAKKAFRVNAEERIKNATVVVMVNAECHAGTCHNHWSSNSEDYGQANAIAYCALGKNDENRRQLMWHEICGHGFGKLADEYYYNKSITNTKPLSDLRNYHVQGLYRNVDCYIDQNLKNQVSDIGDLTTTANVYWHDLFNTTNNYEATEALGVYEGAYTYRSWFCRPTENGYRSIMNQNTGCFNAISRRQILYRILKLSGSVNFTYGSTEELNNFLWWDAENFVYPPSGETRANLVEDVYLIDPPVFTEGSWVNGHFVEAQMVNAE